MSAAGCSFVNRNIDSSDEKKKAWPYRTTLAGRYYAFSPGNRKAAPFFHFGFDPALHMPPPIDYPKRPYLEKTATIELKKNGNTSVHHPAPHINHIRFRNNASGNIKYRVLILLLGKTSSPGMKRTWSYSNCD